MDYSILTPLQLWADFDPEREPLQTAFLRTENKGDICEFDAYINGERYGQENVRIYVHGILPVGSTVDKAVVCVGDDAFTEAGSMGELLRKGFCLIGFDYRGYDPSNPSALCTRYPDEIGYANYAKAGTHLYKAVPTARETCVFVWSKVCRSVIGFAKQLCGAQSRIYLLGVRAGADIMWQAGAMDKRADGLVGVINAGWKDYVGASKYTATSGIADDAFDDENVRWLAGCAPQTYAKFVTCPTLFVGTTNSNITSIDRVENTLNTIREHAPVHVSICAGLNNSVDDTALKTVNAWLKGAATDRPLPNNPKLNLIVEDDKVVAEAKFDDSDDVSEINVYYSYDEMQSDLRSWKKVSLQLANPRTVLPVYVNNKIIFAFVNIVYKKEYRLSSLPDTLSLEGKRLACEPLRKRHLIYERKDGVSMWVVENTDRYSSFVIPTIATGAFDLMGITAPAGDLSTYLVGEPQFRNGLHSLLQFDAYSQNDTSCTISLCADEGNGKHCDYNATVKIKGGAWTKCTLEVQDFKTEERIALKDWGQVKKLTLRKVSGILFNNILWV